MKSGTLLVSFALAIMISIVSPATADTTGQVIVKNFAFSPATLIVTRGTRVTWKNLDGEPHLVAGVDGKFRSQALDQNDTYTLKFDRPGTYKYICTIHPHMKGEIDVK
jgi:plastocyanin